LKGLVELMKRIRFFVLGMAAAVGAATLSAATLSGGTLSAAAQPAGSGWHVAQQLPGTGTVTAMTAAGPHAEWAFAQSSAAKPVTTAWQDTGKGWVRVPFGAAVGEYVVAAAASSPDNVWAFTQDGGPLTRAWHWNGRSWTWHAFPGTFGGAIVLGPDNVWLFGARYYGSGAQLGVLHDNGKQWSGGPGSGQLYGGSASSPGNIWAFGGAYVARWTGTGWARTSLARFLPPLVSACDKPCGQYLDQPAIDAVLALSPGNVYAIATANGQDESGPWALLHYNGHSWSRVTSFAAHDAGQLVSDGHGGIWVLHSRGCCGIGEVLRYADGTVSTAGFPAAIQAVALTAVPGTADVLAGGYTGPSTNPGQKHPVILEYVPR
jgi:hypothetical protein